jgi:hypothetical protein
MRLSVNVLLRVPLVNAARMFCRWKKGCCKRDTLLDALMVEEKNREDEHVEVLPDLMGSDTMCVLY